MKYLDVLIASVPDLCILFTFTDLEQCLVCETLIILINQKGYARLKFWLNRLKLLNRLTICSLQLHFDYL